MDVAGQDSTQNVSGWQGFVGLAWHTLRQPKLTVGLLGVLIVVLLLGLLIPQQTTPTPNAAAWISTLPPLVQLWGEPLFFLGFAHLFQSLWFWLPVALLFLNSLIALADYGPGSWQRLGKTMPTVDWQHPLANRAEHVTRLPKSPDAFLDTLRTSLEAKGFFLYQTDQPEQRMVGAARRRWAWSGTIVIYAGLILLAAAFLVSHYFLKTDRFTLFPLEARSSRLFEGQFELAEVEAEQGVGRVLYSLDQTGASRQALSWRLYLPAFLNNVFILPVAMEPIVTIEVRDATDTLLKLIPVQEDLPPAERLNLPLEEPRAPLYFLISSASLAVRIIPDPTSANTYNVQVRRSSESSPSETIKAQTGQPFEIDDLSVTISVNHSLEVVAYRDPALLLYLVSLGLVVVGGVFIFLRPPLLLWLVPEVKGLGGQLYGVVEKFGSVEAAKQFVEELLSPEVLPESDIEE